MGLPSSFLLLLFDCFVLLKHKTSIFYLCSAVATGGQRGRAPLTIACALPFWFIQITVFGTSRYCNTTTMIELGVITFKHNSPLKFY